MSIVGVARRLAAAAVLLSALTGCDDGYVELPTPASSSTDNTPAATSYRVGTSGMSLTLDGQPWWPTGMNAYQLGTDWKVNEGCGAQVDLDEYFGRLPPNSLTRFNAYSSLAVNKVTGRLDFTALDHVFEAAARHGQLLVAVLTANEGGCEGDDVKEFEWYVDGWRTYVGPRAPMSYPDWVDTAVRRWGASPALAGWTPVGEPEPSKCMTAQCDWQSRTCPANAAAVLRSFFDGVGARIRQLDSDAVIWSGRAGGSQCGSAGEEYQSVSASPGIDVMEYHDYHPLDDLPGDHFDGLDRRIEQARAVNKPLVIAEIGMKAGSCQTLQERARHLSEAIAAQRTRGTAGALFWAFVPDPRLGECTLDIGPGDPLLALVG